MVKFFSPPNGHYQIGIYSKSECVAQLVIVEG